MNFNVAADGIDEFCYWKGSEFRTFLLYTGPVMIKNVLSIEEYKNFLSLHIAARICNDDTVTVFEHLSGEQFFGTFFFFTMIQLSKIDGVAVLEANRHTVTAPSTSNTYGPSSSKKATRCLSCCWSD